MTLQELEVMPSDELRKISGIRDKNGCLTRIARKAEEILYGRNMWAGVRRKAPSYEEQETEYQGWSVEEY